MCPETLIAISGAAEGLLDQAVVVRLIGHVGAELGPIYGGNGKSNLLQRLDGYNRAARHAPWVVLVDLDESADCAPIARAEWLPRPASRMCFRIAVREVEAWLMADRERLARSLAVARSRIPPNPDGIRNPKEWLVSLAARSRRRDILADMVPRAGSNRTVGPAYTSRLMEFATNSETGWRPDVAAEFSGSLKSALRGLRRLVESVD